MRRIPSGRSELGELLIDRVFNPPARRASLWMGEFSRESGGFQMQRESFYYRAAPCDLARQRGFLEALPGPRAAQSAAQYIPSFRSMPSPMPCDSAT